MSKARTSKSIQNWVSDDVAVIRIDRESKLNALTSGMLVDLASLISDYGNGNKVRGIVLTGKGRAFSAGHDLGANNQANNAEQMARSVDAFHDVSRACLRTVVPTVAALNGLAVGGAFEMTLAFDRRIGTPDTEVFLPENARGLVVSNASSILLSRLMSRGGALDFVLGARRVGADKAKQLGLLDEVTECDVVDAAIAKVHEYTPSNSSTAQHLRLFRPLLDEVEEAMEKETAEAMEAWRSGLTARANESFWDNRPVSHRP